MSQNGRTIISGRRLMTEVQGIDSVMNIVSRIFFVSLSEGLSQIRICRFPFLGKNLLAFMLKNYFLMTGSRVVRLFTLFVRFYLRMKTWIKLRVRDTSITVMKSGSCKLYTCGVLF